VTARFGESVQLRLLEGFFACNRAVEAVAEHGHGRFTNGATMD
jgi:hypothetical protein